MLPTPPGVQALIRAHRDAQADQRAAIAADHDRDLTAARVRLAAIETRIRSLGFPALADLLETETDAGTVLIALTCSDEERPTVAATTVGRPAQDELGRALAVFARQRADVGTISRAG
jgi:hypothetical protein